MLQGVRFVGTTLWSDFDALGPLAGQRLPDAPRAKAALAHPARLGMGISGIVDIATLNEPRDKGFQIGRLITGPAALAQLARQIGGQLARAGGKARDIRERHLLKTRAIKRLWRAPGTAFMAGLRAGRLHLATFVPQSMLNENVAHPHLYPVATFSNGLAAPRRGKNRRAGYSHRPFTRFGRQAFCGEIQ